MLNVLNFGFIMWNAVMLKIISVPFIKNCAMTLSMTPFHVKGLFAALNIKDTQHINILALC
jgi:hypothetical protein